MTANKFKIENRRYLGSKTRLLSFIHSVVTENCNDINSFVDLFGGTGNVAYSFNNKNTKIIINDFLKSNYYSFIAFFGSENIDSKKLAEKNIFYNACDNFEENYFSINFSNTYFSHYNCQKIGFIRDDIESDFIANKINFREKAYLITSLIYAMDHIANTVGHYDAFRMNGDLNKTLLLKELEVPTPIVNQKNEIYNEDSNELVKKIKADLVYIDPPYNSRQYCDAYHLLENVARWEKPEVYGTAKKMNRDSSIKSSYCTQKAPKIFDDLIKNINSKYILVSYNNTGAKGAGRSQAKISDSDIINSLSKKGDVQVFSTSFNQFTTGKSNFENHEERLFLCKCYDEKYVKSPLNYTGGKYKLLPQLFDIFDDSKEKFIDVFGGGFNVGINSKASFVLYNDKQIQVQRIIKLLYENKYEEINKKIESIILKYNLTNTFEKGYEYYDCDSSTGVGKANKQGYESLKQAYNLCDDSLEKDYLLLTLIFYSFNNQIRFNSKKEYNLPVGKRDYNKSLRNNLEEFTRRMKNKKIVFSSKDFEELEKEIDKDCFVYCDPPYFLGIASYNENNGWSITDEKRLLNFLSRLNKKGVKFALSNLIEHHGKDHNLLREWAKTNDFKIHYLKANYSNSNYHIKDKSNDSKEVLITNY